MTELKQIIDLLESVWNGPAWHGPAVWAVLEDVAPADAVRRVGGAHAIVELVSHMAAWEQAVIRGLETGVAQVASEDNFRAVPWPAAISDLRNAQHRLLQLISSLTQADLDRPIQGEDPQPHTVRSTLYGLVQHDVYHSGQIQILKRALAQ
jgi:uncharacterized damage-inducible protein DinB